MKIEVTDYEMTAGEVERRQFICYTHRIGTNLMRLGDAIACAFLSYSLYVTQ